MQKLFLYTNLEVDIATNNHRSISLLSTISKVFERLLYVRLEKFLSRNNVIIKQQFGFRQGYSTDMAVADLCSMLQRYYDDGYLTCCIFLDLSKAFNKVLFLVVVAITSNVVLLSRWQ